MSTKARVTTKGDLSLVPPPEQEPEQQPGGLGDNSEAEERAFRKAMRRMIALAEERKSLNARIGKERKQMKADGIVLKHLDATIAMLEWEPAEVREQFATQARYAKFAGLPVGEQVDLFAHADDDEVAREDWRARGRSDALRLKEASPPKSCPPEHHQDYLDGHSEARWWSDEVDA